MISVSDLMQVTHPGHRLFVRDKNIKDDEFPVFLDYCVCVCDRFSHYIQQYGTNSLITESSLLMVIEGMKEIDGCDDPAVVLPIREKLTEAIADFLTTCESMSRCFTNPSTIKNFYHKLGEKLHDEVVLYAGLLV